MDVQRVTRRKPTWTDCTPLLLIMLDVYLETISSGNVKNINVLLLPHRHTDTLVCVIFVEAKMSFMRS